MNIKETDEYNSTKLCYKCNYVLLSYYPENNKYLETEKRYQKFAERYINARGARYTKLKYCRKCKHVIDRDFNASINIALIGNHLNKFDKKRPELFQRTWIWS